MRALRASSRGRPEIGYRERRAASRSLISHALFRLIYPEYESDSEMAWALKATETAMDAMRNLTRFPYGLPKLDFIFLQDVHWLLRLPSSHRETSRFSSPPVD